MTSRRIILGLSGLLAAGTLLAGSSSVASPSQIAREIAAKEQVSVFESPFYKIDRIYRSMTGPESTAPVELETGQPPELLWITGYSADVVGQSGDPVGMEQFMCHSNLDVNSAEYQQDFHLDHGVNPRLFTLSQGQMDIEFPPGFGIPILSNENLSLTTQVLNLNYQYCDGMEVEHRTSIRYVRNRDLDFPMRALYENAVYGLKALKGSDGHYGEDPAMANMDHPGHDTASCLPGANAGGYEYRDAYGRVMTGHWVVEPGVEVNHTPVDSMLALKEDTMIHFIAVHLHPFARSLELFDDTSQKTVWKADAQNPAGRIGLDHVDSLSSAGGIPLFKDHHYELISTYDNTTSVPQDSMAVMYLYLEDPHFRKPALPGQGASAVATR